MPLINADAKALEWYVAAYLSQDKTAIKEIWNGEDIHGNNQKDLHLPSRLIAKVYLFRLIFGGSAYAYANDYDFKDVGYSERKWQQVIDRTYEKYSGLYQWHNSLVDEVVRTGQVEVATGRIWTFSKEPVGNRTDWPRTKILNYPVQGTAADLMSIVRVSTRNRMKARNLKGLFVCTVHDSMLIDSPEEEVKETGQLIQGVFNDVPKNFHKLFGVEFNLPLRVEVQVGENWGDMNDFVINTKSDLT